MKVVGYKQRLDAAGASAVFVVHDDPQLVRTTMLAEVECPYPVLVDEWRRAYREWGLRRAAWHQVWLDPGVWTQYARLLRSGERIRGLGRDTRQLGGDFVLDRQLRLAYARRQHRDDRPPVGELLKAVEGVA